LFDCYQLKSGTIEMFVPRDSIGNYLLYDRTYRIRYVGRSDTDLQSRLLGHVNEDIIGTRKNCHIFQKNRLFKPLEA